MENKNNLTYTEAVKELESLVSQIENEDIAVDDLLQKVKRSSELIRFCQSKLTQTEDEVYKVLDNMKEETKASNGSKNAGEEKSSKEGEKDADEQASSSEQTGEKE
ncbi:MAG: exodeoxyribonuclease VII small subunit [Bacteroidales bacterium]|nr:exodeoxyribonuclease VII small subunit [Bacteroidales bacterium]MCF8338856.1 exodeoxyribonuclease VII small subunit [Bacteroidales bacterium]